MMLESRADTVSMLGMVFVAGWISCSAYYAIPHLWQKQAQLIQVQTKEVPKLKAIAGCQSLRAKIATTEAVKSENGADVDLREIPNCPALPKPNK